MNIIGEIGVNHFGNSKYLDLYLNELKNKKIDGISIQILNKKKTKTKLKKFCLKKKRNKKIFFESKKKF